MCLLMSTYHCLAIFFSYLCTFLETVSYLLGIKQTLRQVCKRIRNSFVGLEDHPCLLLLPRVSLRLCVELAVVSLASVLCYRAVS